MDKLDLLSQAVVENVEDGVIVIDTGRKITVFNSAASRYSGYTAEGVMGKIFEEAIKFETVHDQSPLEKINSILVGRLVTSLYYQASVITPMDEINPIIYKLVPVMENGQVAGCLFVFRDHKLDRLKIDILSIVAHQLKTPLGSMRWNLEALLEGQVIKKDAATRDVVEDIYSANSRIIALVDDLLNASRIDQRKVANKPQMVKIPDVVGATVKELEFQARKKEVNLIVDLKYEGEILIDPKRLREVFQNLISNAIKYNRPKGSITIKDQNLGEKVQVDIGDTGIGIPETDLPKIFSRSFRAKNAMESEIDGSGLGLFVAKSFVEDWGGTISCQSQVGSGTIISFTIPLKAKESVLNQNITEFIN